MYYSLYSCRSQTLHSINLIPHGIILLFLMSVLLPVLILAHYFFLLELFIEQSKQTCTNVKFLKDRYTINYTSVSLSG